jgi:hypothetical protein
MMVWLRDNQPRDAYAVAMYFLSLGDAGRFPETFRDVPLALPRGW